MSIWVSLELAPKVHKGSLPALSKEHFKRHLRQHIEEPLKENFKMHFKEKFGEHIKK